MAKAGPILLIDDDLDECELIADVLQRIGVNNRLICFPNGKEALNYLITTTEQPFIILADINMPIMGGLELRKRIQENERLRTKSIPFIFLTTTAQPAAIKDAYEMCVQGFFEKRSNVNAIEQLLKEIYNYWQQCHHPNN